MTTSTTPKYSIVFEGKVRELYNIPTASKHLAQVFDMSDEKVKTLVENAATKPVKIFDNLPYDEAKVLAQKVFESGFRCQLVPEHISFDLGKSVLDDVGKPQPKKEVKYWIYCPDCFHKQDDDNELCEQCGIALHK